MPKPAPEAERLSGVDDDTAVAVPAAVARPASARTWRWAGFAVFLLVLVVLYDAYLHLSQTYPENSDEANILLMANDMLHGNVFLSGWNVSDVPFITTELPEIALLVWLFGLHMGTAHIAAAVTYTVVVALGMLLAKGRATGANAVTRMALALAIMLAPQLGVGVFVVVFSVGHIGTAAPVMLTWLVLDRLGLTRDGGPRSPRRFWWVPVLIAVMLGWALMADPLVLVIAIFPLLLCCLVRVVSSLTIALRNGPGRHVLRTLLAQRWLELSLAAAAGVGYLTVSVGRQLLSNAGGYNQEPVPFQIDAASKWFMQARVVVHGLLQMFGAYFVPGQAVNYLSPGNYLISPGLSGLDQAVAIARVVCVLAAIWGACAIARRFFRRDADFVSQLLLAGIVANLAAYIPSSLADHTALNVREIAPVLPFAAVLAARMLGDRLLSFGPVASFRLPKIGRQVRLRLIAVPLIALFGWYSFGLFSEAGTAPAPNPFAQLEAFLEANHFSYGLGGYWEASIITVDTGGAVTIRAVTPACLQPYEWESKADWHDADQHVANFLVLDNVAGYFSQFEESAAALKVLNAVYSGPERAWLGTGGYVLQNVPGKSQPVVMWFYSVRWYQGNLLAQIPLVYQALNDPAPTAQDPNPAQNVCQQSS